MKHALSIVVALIPLCGCGESLSPTTPTPTTIQGLRITVPFNIEMGQSRQVSAVTVLADGGTQAVEPSSITWQSSDPAAASISATGVFFARREGVVTIRGVYREWTSDPASVIVTPRPPKLARLDVGEYVEGALAAHGTSTLYELTPSFDGSVIVRLN